MSKKEQLRIKKIFDPVCLFTNAQMLPTVYDVGNYENLAIRKHTQKEFFRGALARSESFFKVNSKRCQSKGNITTLFSEKETG